MKTNGVGLICLRLLIYYIYVLYKVLAGQLYIRHIERLRVQIIVTTRVVIKRFKSYLIIELMF